MGTMTTSPATTDHPEQLTFLPATPVPVQFRLDEATRRRGLAHVAAIRAQLEQVTTERKARSTLSGRARSLPARTSTRHAA